MKIFAIRDDVYAPQKDLAYLFYYEEAKCFYIELPDDADPWETPILLSSFAERGMYTINSYWSKVWVQQRIVPRDRQNIGHVLRDNGLSCYDEFELLMLAMGRCAQDDYYLVPRSEKELPPEIQERLMRKVTSITTLDAYEVKVEFCNGSSNVCNLKPYFEEHSKFGVPLRKPELFPYVRIEAGGYGISWDWNLVVPDDALYFYNQHK